MGSTIGIPAKLILTPIARLAQKRISRGIIRRQQREPDSDMHEERDLLLRPVIFPHTLVKGTGEGVKFFSRGVWGIVVRPGLVVQSQEYLSFTCWTGS